MNYFNPEIIKLYSVAYKKCIDKGIDPMGYDVIKAHADKNGFKPNVEFKILNWIKETQDEMEMFKM